MIEPLCCRYVTSNWAKVTEAVVVAATSAVIGFILIYTVDDCVPTPEEGDYEGHSQVTGFCSTHLVQYLLIQPTDTNSHWRL